MACSSFPSFSDSCEQAWDLSSLCLLHLCDLKLATSQDLQRPTCSGTLHPSPPVPWDTKSRWWPLRILSASRAPLSQRGSIIPLGPTRKRSHKGNLGCPGLQVVGPGSTSSLAALPCERLTCLICGLFVNRWQPLGNL